MTETLKRDAGRTTMALTASSMGHDFLAAILTELKTISGPWSQLSEQQQQQTIERLKEKIRSGIDKAVEIMVRGEYPVVPALVKAVSVGENIRASLSVGRDALCRHALCDAQGKEVLVVIADTSRWTQRMDEIKAKGDQLDLWDGDYDPSQDQPGYRRDQEPELKGPSWADIKKSLGMGQPQAEGDAAPSSEPPSTDDPLIDSSLGEQREWTVGLRILQEQLSQVGVAVSLGALRARTDEELHAAREWAEAYNPVDGSSPIERPTWFPPPEEGAKQ